MRKARYNAKRKASTKVIWIATVLRRSRDLVKLAAGLLCGDPVCMKFHAGLGQWLQRWSEAPQPPLCLTCEHEFRTDASPPSNFMMTYSDDPRVEYVMLSAICTSCAERSDAELLAIGSKDASQLLGGEVSGFVAAQASTTTH